MTRNNIRSVYRKIEHSAEEFEQKSTIPYKKISGIFEMSFVRSQR